MTEKSPPVSERIARWTPKPRPDWLQQLNREGACLDIQGIVPINPASLLETAVANAGGLNNFGDEDWREPFEVVVKAIEQEAELSLMGRIMARSDLLNWLENRLLVEETYRLHPEIEDELIEAPVFITGLPRSGTSILFELLARDEQVRVPQSWEAMFPCPPPEQESYHHDPRITLADQRLTQWNRVAPEYQSMHEMGATIPCECLSLMNHSFISDQLRSIHQVPSYDQWLAKADLTPAYRYHKRLLKLLQWRCPGRWLLKAPSHMGSLDTLLQTYPDARIVQTHRDPIVAMASVTNLLGTIYWMRSDKVFDSTAFGELMMAKATAKRLEHVMEQCERGIIPVQQIYHSSYQQLLEHPMVAIEAFYDFFKLPLSDKSRAAMQAYLDQKPKGKFGSHQYSVDSASEIAASRKLFQRYQNFYQVNNEI